VRHRVFSLRNVFGLVLAILGVICVLILAHMTLPATTSLLVASVDLKPGDGLSSSTVHQEDWMNVDPVSVSNMVTVDQIDDVRGARVAVGQMIPSGHPISLSQLVLDQKLNGQLDRLTLLAQPNMTVFPLDMQPGQVGNWVQPGDYVDLIFSVGAVQGGEFPIPSQQPPANSLSSPGATPQAAQVPQTGIIGAGGQPTPGVVQVPIATVPLINVRILRVDYEQKQVYVSTAGGGQTTRYVNGNVTRIYVELSPQDAMVVSFLLQAGVVRAASHRDLINGQNPYPGLSWTDFVNWFMSKRPDLFYKPTPGAPAPQPTAVKK
jgi:hypothetical protein